LLNAPTPSEAGSFAPNDSPQPLTPNAPQGNSFGPGSGEEGENDPQFSTFSGPIEEGEVDPPYGLLDAVNDSYGSVENQSATTLSVLTNDTGYTGISSFTQGAQGNFDTAGVKLFVDEVGPIAIDDQATTDEDVAVNGMQRNPFRFPFTITSLTVICLGLSIHELARAQEANNPPARAFLHGSRLYFLAWTSKRDPQSTRLQILENGQLLKTDIRAGILYPTSASHFRIAHGVAWDSVGGIDFGLQTFRIPLDELHFYDQAHPHYEERFRTRFPTMDDSIYEQSVCFTPAATWFRNLQDTNQRIDAFADFYPISPKAGLLFLFHKRTCQVWNGTIAYQRLPKMDPMLPTKWKDSFPDKPQEIIDCPFNESFSVYSHSKSYFFLTYSHQLFIGTFSEKGHRKIVPFWDKADQPIDRIITDSNTNRSFAFTKPIKHPDGTVAKPIYFELIEQLEPKEYDPKHVRIRELDSPAKAMQAALDVLVDAAEIKIPTDKK
jgi:hypothetical protein